MVFVVLFVLHLTDMYNSVLFIKGSSYIPVSGMFTLYPDATERGLLPVLLCCFATSSDVIGGALGAIVGVILHGCSADSDIDRCVDCSSATRFCMIRSIKLGM